MILALTIIRNTSQWQPWGTLSALAASGFIWVCCWLLAKACAGEFQREDLEWQQKLKQLDAEVEAEDCPWSDGGGI